ncbi:MAG: hypothetical protein QOE49_5907 [Rhodospirillaceae bacterium]|jgi:hypothetical protein|nr:hypothetical protein [Rhodospirillaceae bacterium]MEA2810321.1 hypothetical protein [Rhodospirillaceae bacterium]
MKLGLFMMPLQTGAGSGLAENREAILLAEKLGYEEAWVGEHYGARTEPIPDPLQFMVALIPPRRARLFKVMDKNRSEMMVEAIDIVHASGAPIRPTNSIARSPL